jgi:hypothetical protein
MAWYGTVVSSLWIFRGAERGCSTYVPKEQPRRVGMGRTLSWEEMHVWRDVDVDLCVSDLYALSMRNDTLNLVRFGSWR